jgi:glycosyltransferase involved in cell wall biosynthesis
MTATGISVAVIAMNEADRIQQLINSVQFADELIVVDSGSTDGTDEICRQSGVTVVIQPWQGYARQKQIAMDRAKNSWILNLDADEVVSEALAVEIKEAVRRAKPDQVAFRMPRLSRYLGRWIRHGGWFPDRKVRLVRKGAARWTGKDLHEQLEVDGEVVDLTQPLLHYVYRNISDQVKTIDRFSDVYADSRDPRSGWFVWLGVLHAVGKFVECFLWKRGFLDGLAGLIIAMNSSWYVFLKHAKSWERAKYTKQQGRSANGV